jgi:hypothetical protein
MIPGALLNVLQFTLRKALLDYVFMLTLRLEGHHLSFLQAPRQGEKLYFRLPSFLICWHVLITSPLYVYTSVLFYKLSTSLELSRTVYALPHILPSGYGFSPREKKSLIWIFVYLNLIQDPTFGLLVFTPEANPNPI